MKHDDNKTTQVTGIHHLMLPFGIVKHGCDVTDCRQRPKRHKPCGHISTVQEVHKRFTLIPETSLADEWSAIAKVIFRNGQRSYDTDCDAQDST